MISSHVKISMISLISSLSLKLYLNSLVHHRNIFGSSSKVFGNLRTSSGTFVLPPEQFYKIFGKWSEIFGKSSKTPSSVCLYNKKNITRWLEDMNFMFSWHEQYSHEWAQRTSEILFLPLVHKIHIFSPPCNILYISYNIIIKYIHWMVFELVFLLTWRWKPSIFSLWLRNSGWKTIR